MKLALLNASQASDDEMASIGQALAIYLAIVADAWERKPPSIEFMKGLQVAPPDYIPLVAMNDADTPGCIGYHDLDPMGRPYGRAFLHMVPGSVVLRDPSNQGESLAGCLSHEAAEIFGDEYANLYADGPLFDPISREEHAMVAVEIGDPPQSQAWPINVGGVDVDVSNFVYPAWFSVRAVGQKVDQLGRLQMPLTIAPGGYAIVREGGTEGQVFARLFRPRRRSCVVKKVYHPTERPALWREKMKLAPGGRTSRRLACR